MQGPQSQYAHHAGSCSLRRNGLKVRSNSCARRMMAQFLGMTFLAWGAFDVHASMVNFAAEPRRATEAEVQARMVEDDMLAHMPSCARSENPLDPAALECAKQCISKWKAACHSEPWAGAIKDFGIKNYRPCSQHSEDLTMLERHFTLPSGEPKLNGVFMEIGAWDGVGASNTLLYERCLGWEGVMVEGNPRVYTSMKRGDHRPRSFKANVVPGCIKNDVMYFSHKAKYNNAQVTEDQDQGIPVRCSSLAGLLDQIGVYHVDFFSLDVENKELEVLQTLFTQSTPLSRATHRHPIRNRHMRLNATHDVSIVHADPSSRSIEVTHMMVESWNKNCQKECPRREMVRELVLSHGYAMLQGVPASDVFKLKSV